MIVVIVDHYVKPGLMEAAERRVNANGALAADAPGFRFRYTLIERDNPLKLTAVTGWDSEETYAAHVEARQAHQQGPAFSGERPYERVVNEVFQVKGAEVAAAR